MRTCSAPSSSRMVGAAPRVVADELARPLPASIGLTSSSGKLLESRERFVENHAGDFPMSGRGVLAGRTFLHPPVSSRETFAGRRSTKSLKPNESRFGSSQIGSWLENMTERIGALIAITSRHPARCRCRRCREREAARARGLKARSDATRFSFRRCRESNKDFPPSSVRHCAAESESRRA